MTAEQHPVHSSSDEPGPGNSKTSRRLALVGSLVVVGALGFALAARTKEAKQTKADLEAKQAAAPKPQLEAPPPETTSPKPERWAPVLQVTGTLVPAEEADLAFKAGGRLATVHVQVGDVVKKGAKLATVDAAEAEAQAAAANAGVRSAEVALAMSVDAEHRAQALWKTGSVPEIEKTTAEQRAAMSRAQLEQARAQARLASTAVGNAVLTAPFDGVVTRVPTGTGKIVAPGEPLFHLENLSLLKLNGTLGEAEAKLVKVGAELDVNGAVGKITAVLSSLDAQTRRVPLFAEVPNPGTLLARSFVRATVKSKDPIDVLRVPANVLVPGSQDQVAVVGGGALHLRTISFFATPTGLLVQSGLAAGDVVVVAPGADVKEGTPFAGKK